MKICQNCASTNEADAVQCSTCSMKGMLIDAVTTPEKNSTIKSIHTTCINCGTTEIGEEDNCMKCNFPISKKTNDRTLHNPKVKRS